MLAGLSQINIELNSTCGKHTHCAFCGHQDAAVHPQRQDGEMSKAMVAELAADLAPLGKNLVVQFHRDGEAFAGGGAASVDEFEAMAEDDGAGLV